MQMHYIILVCEELNPCLLLIPWQLLFRQLLVPDCFPYYFQMVWKQRQISFSILALGTGVCMLSLYLFSPVETPVPFYICSGLTRFFFAGFNTAIYAIIPDCVEYGEWKTGVRNDGFQYAFIPLGNKIGIAIGTSVFAAVPGAAGFEANMQQKPCCVRK